MRPILLFIACCLIASPSRAVELPLDDFVKHGDYLDMSISPDGEHLAARMRHDGLVFLVFIRRSDGQVVGGVRPEGNSEIHSVTWVNNERVVFEYAEKVSHFDAPVRTGELYATNIDGSKRKLIYGYRAGDGTTGTRFQTREDTDASQEVLSVLPDDDKRILIIEYPFSTVGKYLYDNREKPSIISKLNVYSGKKKFVEALPYNGAEAVASLDGVVNYIRWEAENGRYRSAYRENGEGDWTPLDVSFSDYVPLPVGVNANATKVYFQIPYGQDEFNTLYELDLASGEYVQLFDGLDSDLNRWVTDPKTLEPVIGVTEFNRSAYHYVESDSDLVKVHKMLARAFKGKDIFIASATPDGKHVVFRIASDQDPGEYHILNTETRSAEFLMANRSWINPELMRPMEHLQFQADDELNYYGFLTMPALAEGDPAPPLLVIPHGGPHGARDYWQYDSEVQLFANRGYAVLQVNFRGSGGYGNVFEKLGYREWGGRMIDDIVGATRSVAESGRVDSDRVCIYGGSYGGYAALMSAVKASDLFRCTIGFAGVYDLSRMYETGDIPESWGGMAYLERVLGRDEAQLAENSPVNHVDKLEAAVMLIHGKQDQRVPVEHAEVLRERLETAGKEVVWQLYNRSGHGIFSVESRREMYQGILDFLDSHIGAPSEPGL